MEVPLETFGRNIHKDHSVLLDISAANTVLTGQKRQFLGWQEDQTAANAQL